MTGDFLYRRVAGIEPIEAGYGRFRVKPLIGGGLTQARGETETPYGRIVSEWKVEGSVFTQEVQVPVGAVFELTLPDGKTELLPSGHYVRSCAVG